ncbi:hypothetical protein ACP70R_003798 [Stipagrostis hirtigluma subsp. patula]
MAQTSRAKKAARSGSREDRISALPDDVLHHVLGFLPAEEAVQTSILARRWRHLSRSMRRLCLTDESRHWNADELNEFMNSLLLLRDPSVALDEVKFTETESHFCNRDTYIDTWIRHVLFCQARVLSIVPCHAEGNLVLYGSPLVAQHLQKLEFAYVDLRRSFLDFASCPQLMDLKITYCTIYCDRILSKSIKHLSITHSSMHCKQIHISVPGLISLQLYEYRFRTPLLDDMPSLETAIFSFGSRDYCKKAASVGLCICAKCWDDTDQNRNSILLGGLSSAMDLELICNSGTLIFSAWCPTFSKLKTLLLHVPHKFNDLQLIVCILEHSPVLEKLTLRVPKVLECARESVSSYHPMEQLSAISKYLNTVEIKCGEVDERVCRILKLLSRFVKHINIDLIDEP